MKQCKDCIWYEFESITNQKVMCCKWGWIKKATCNGYTRKWWKFWRPK